MPTRPSPAMLKPSKNKAFKDMQSLSRERILTNGKKWLLTCTFFPTLYFSERLQKKGV